MNPASLAACAALALVAAVALLPGASACPELRPPYPTFCKAPCGCPSQLPFGVIPYVECEAGSVAAGAGEDAGWATEVALAVLFGC